MKRTFKFTPKSFSSKCSCRNYESNFEHPAEKSLTESRFFPFIDRKRWKNFLFSNFFSSKNPYTQIGYNFDNPVEKKKTEVQKRQSMSQTNEKKWVFHKLLFWKCFFFGQEYCSIDNTVEKVSTENRHAVAPCLKMFQKSFQKNFILITFSQRTRRIQVSQSRRKNSDRKGFALGSENMKKVLILGFFSEKVFMDT